MQRHYRKYVKKYMGKTDVKSQPRLRLGHEGGPRSRHHSISEKSYGNLGLYKWALGEYANDPALKACDPTRFGVTHLTDPLTRTSSPN